MGTTHTGRRGARYRNRKEGGPAGKRRMAIAFAMFLGFVGVHRFTLGQWHIGLLFVFLFVVSNIAGLFLPGFYGIPWFSLAAAIAYFEAYRFYRMSDGEFADRYLEEVDDVSRVPGRYLAGTAAPHPRAVSARARRRIAVQAGDRFEAYDYLGAAELYEEALELDLADGESRVLAARCYSLLEDAQAAYRHLRRAVQLRADNLDLVDVDAGFAWLRTRNDFGERRRAGFATPAPEQSGAAPLSEEPAGTSGPGDTAPPQLGARTHDVLDRLEQLGRLRRRGLLDDEEFAREKRRLLR